MSLKKNSHFVLIGGLPNENTGRALGPYRIRTVLENHGYTCSLIDFEDILTSDELDKILNYCVGPDTLAIGLSFVWAMLRWETEEQILQFKRIKDNQQQRFPNVKITIGTQTIGRIPIELLKLTDWVVSGYGELSMPLLMQYLKYGTGNLKYTNLKNYDYDVNYIDSNRDYPIDDMDLMFTRYHPDDQYKSYQALSLEISRGCVFNCAFCKFAFKNKKIRDYVRTEKSIAEELRQNYDLFGTTRYMLADDTFNDSIEKIDTLKRAVDLARLPDFEYVAYIRPEMLVTRPAMIKALASSGLRGGHYGIESGNNSTRKLIGRPIAIEKIIDATAELKQLAPKLRLAGTLIVGLPGDTKEDPGIWNETFVKHQPNFLDWWYYAPLHIHRKNIGETIIFGKNKDEFNSINLADNTKSPIEENPEKYGYDVSDIDPTSVFVNWKNKYMDYKEATKLSDFYSIEKWKSYRWGGWRIGTAWYYNIPDEDLEKQNYKQLMDRCSYTSPSVYTTHRKNYWLNLINQNIS
jgi:hypothetical protein